MRVAIVHDWMTGMRGGEAILDAICELYPEADLYTLLWTDTAMSPRILNGRRVFTSFLQPLMRFSVFRTGYRKLLPFFPLAAARFDLSGYDLVLSNTHCVAKGAGGVRPDAVHVAYVSTPMRYVWDMFEEYFGPGRASWPVRIAAKVARPWLQRWDRRTNDSMDLLLANSRFVQWRIRQFWGLGSEVLHPFVDLERFQPSGKAPEDFYLVVSAFAPYKRLDLAVEAFRESGLRLKILGKGQDEARLRALAQGAANIEFLGGLSNDEVADLYRRCKALIFPGLEDFGITPLEAMASGRPVIAYGRGGILDTVTAATGILFAEQSAKSLAEAVAKLEKGELSFNPATCRARAEQFSRAEFLRKYAERLSRVLEGSSVV